MRNSDRLRIAARGISGRWAMLITLGMAIAAFCLCFAGAVLTSVQQEKSQPYELSVISGSSDVSDSAIAEISKLEDVTAATELLELQATVTAGKYKAELILTGIDGAYVKEMLAEGTMFPDTSVMPYIVLNEAALKQFKTEETVYSGRSDEAGTDWLNAQVSVQAGDKAVISKICGILENGENDGAETQEPAAYISLSAAKELLIGNGQSVAYTEALVRITNIGCADTVTKQISKLGLRVNNSASDLQAGWDAELKEMAYLIVVGAFCLLCSVVLLTAWRKISLLEKADVYVMLLWAGWLKKDIRRMFALQAGIISVIGAAIGVLVSAMLPSFLMAGGSGQSIYVLPVPVLGAAVSAGVCVSAGVVPLMFSKIKGLFFG